MILNLISKLQNAQMAHHSTVQFRSGGFCAKILDILWDNGFIGGYTHLGGGILSITLLYEDGKPLLKRLTVLSRPTRKLYASWEEVSALEFPGGLFIVSTTSGLMSAGEAARKRLGGEIVAYFG